MKVSGPTRARVVPAASGRSSSSRKVAARVVDVERLEAGQPAPDHRQDGRDLRHGGEAGEEVVPGPVDQARPHQRRRGEGRPHRLLAQRLGAVGRRGRVRGDAERRDVQVPRRPGPGEPGDPRRALDVHRLEALAPLPADAHEVDDDLGAAHGRAHPVLVGEGRRRSPR